MREAKIIGAAVLALLTLIVVLQNTERVLVKLLFFSVEVPAALLLFVTALAGFLLGLAASFLVGRRRKPQSPPISAPPRP